MEKVVDTKETTRKKTASLDITLDTFFILKHLVFRGRRAAPNKRLDISPS
jgi:hypothetical protein